MDAVLNWLWQGVVVAMAAAAMLHVLDRARAAVRCTVCWVALLVVVALPFVPLAIDAFVPETRTVSTAPLVAVPNGWWTSGALVAGLWTTWVVIYALRIAGAVVVVRRARRASAPFPIALAEALPHWQRVREAGRRAPLAVSDRVRTAAVLGGGAPIIAVTPTLVDRLHPNELDRVVIHEWAHVQRRDDLTNIGQLIVRAAAGWHPAVWWLDRRLAIEQELACDEIVVAVSGGARSYASCLVKLASARPAARDVLLAAGALSSAGITRRVARLITRRDFASSTWSRRAAAAVVAILLVLAVGIAPLRIVEAAVAATVVRVLQPVVQVAPAHEATPASQWPDSPRREPPQRTPPPSAGRLTMAEHVPVTAAWNSPAAPVRADAAAELEAAAPPAPEASLAAIEASASPLPRSTPPAAVASPLEVDAAARSAWSQAAEAGAAIGLGSRKAGVATAGAFTRFAKKIAGSF